MKIVFLDSTIEYCSLHLVGNKVAEDGVFLSNSLIELGENIQLVLFNFFINSFSSEKYFQFYHDNGIDYNVVYGTVTQIFDNPECLFDLSVNMAKYLYEQSTHPKIKGGEFYMVYFKDCLLDGEVVDAVGLFKSEKKDTFLKVLYENGNVNLASEQGVNIKKLDKGCLIFNKERENGYIVAVVDNTNRGVDAQYWIDDFLHVRQRRDEYFNTENIMSIAKRFITKELPKGYEVQKADQIDLLNRSLQFFKEKDTFNIDDFSQTVLEQPEVIESFTNYKKTFEEEHAMEIDDSFTISQNAYKKLQRNYKRIIRLDKKIQIIIDGNRDHVEQGEDEKGKYYKVYYSSED
ncbi:MAG: nucleoid-associated protein [Aeriscardovia sp.]|nr:nucleoid-associated protein [Aeriscardovia sp.]